MEPELDVNLSKFRGFARITNAVAVGRRVEGVLTLEVEDKANGWVFDYEESKQYFKDWFNEIYNATDGKSWGNVRLMHQLHVSGKICEEPVFDDEKKLIKCAVEVTDDKSWEMVENGTVCGFSFSGIKVPPTQEILNKWSNLPNASKRYIGKPFEVSLVDNPNQGGAYWKVVSNSFQFTNEEGKTEERKFKISNTSFYALADLSNVLSSLRWQDVGDAELQSEFDKHVNGLIGVLAKMGKNLKEEHKEVMLTENAAQGDIEMSTDADANTVMNSAALTEIFNTSFTTFKTEIGTTIKELVTNAVAAELKSLDIDGIKNNITTLTDKLEKTAATTTVVSKTGTDDVSVFNAAASGVNVSEEDKKALELIHNITTVKKA